VLDDLLADPEHVVRLELHRYVADELLVDAVERVLVLHREAAARLLERGVARREVAVAGEDTAGLAADRRRSRGQGIRAGLAAVGAERREHHRAGRGGPRARSRRRLRR